MIVGKRMTQEPITVEPADLSIRAVHKMQAGGFRRLPVVRDGKLVGVISDRDLREHRGHLEQVKVNDIMSENPITVTPETTVEEAAQIMLERQIGGLPVLADGHLVGIITASDIMRAFLDVMGASHGGSSRIDFILEGEEHGFVEATRLVAREGAEVLGVGTYREKLGDNSVCYLRIVSGAPDHIAKTLRRSGFNVLGVHKIAA
ncbi:MAG TPA: CBS domain-containing protein [Candidatus Binatia bacterium]|nr:CBS domain-containing protein [Candidatus Binatia bacterium]